MVWPNGSESIPTVTSEFNPARKNPVTGIVQPHNGIDLIGWDVVVAPFAGTIIYAGYNGGAGNEVRIRADNGDVYRLLHNRAFIRTGGRVEEGTPVAYMGTTGQSTGKHCHFETKPGGGYAVNPRTYMSGKAGAPANLGSGQRTAGVNGVKRRKEPTSKSAEAGELLAPGTVGNFTGWIHGENVSGNDVWYQGTSGDWFWSGGFKEGANGTGLKDLNKTSLAPTQRQAGPNGVRRRADASSKAKETGDLLAPGAIGNFNGWKTGESVSGNDVWFRGASSGDWFWSGGFTDTGKHDLSDLNPPKVPAKDPNQRTAGADGVKRRKEPTSKSPEAGALLAAGTVGNFKGWATGEDVNGNSLWYQGTSGDWFWSGGFVEAPSKTGLTEVKIEPPKPEPEPEPSSGVRTVGPASANGRSGPYRTQGIVTSAASGAKVEMDAWTTGESVESNAIWFRKKGTAQWFWSGGFTDKTATGLLRVTYTGPSGPKELKKFFTGAKTRYEVEMGGVRDSTGKLTANRPAGGDAIRRIWIHHCAATSDQLNYFLGSNERKSCPTVYVRTGGELLEFVPYAQRPWSTGAADADALTVETQNTSGAPSWGISEKSHESIAQWIAWVAQQDKIDGLKVEFFPTADTVKGHNSAPGAATACPGPSMNIPWIIARAQAIIADAEVSEPVEPEIPTDPGTGDDISEIKTAWAEYQTALAAVDPAFQKLDAAISNA